MACACNRKKGQTPQSYTVTAPDGSQTAYRSEIEAKAAAIRNGGTVRAVS